MENISDKRTDQTQYKHNSQTQQLTKHIVKYLISDNGLTRVLDNT